jgi:iron complex outermembrane recepter protein
LRGPQGTLYGANSMGGLLKFVTIDPSTAGYSGRISAGTDSVQNGTAPGYNVRGALNMPISESFAVRASAYTREDPGYIDNPVLGLKDVNKATAAGGRLSALWKPSADLSLKLSALYDKSRSNGSAEINVPTAGFPQTNRLGDLQNNYMPGVGGYDRTTQAYSAILKAKLGAVDITSLTGYNINRYFNTLDWSTAFGPDVQRHFGVGGALFDDYNKIEKVTQEVRLSAPVGPNIDVLGGVFYTHERTAGQEILWAAQPATAQIVGQDWFLSFPRKYEEYAAFADVTYRVTERFDVQIGGRQSHVTESEDPFFQSGPHVGPQPSIAPGDSGTGNAFTYLFTPRFKLSPGVMVYGRFASGYRAGGGNNNPGAPPSYAPDKTQNYEVGFKGDFLSHTLSVDASVYRINWKDIQIQLTSPQGFIYSTNGGAAKSQGVELSLAANPITGLNISGWVTFSDAALTQSFPAASPAYGVAGDRLPYSSRFSGHLSLEQEFPLSPGVRGFLGGDVSRVGPREGVFTGTADRQHFDGYTQGNLRTGLRFDSWTANIYANNIGNSRGVINGGTGYLLPFAFTILQPRTIGVSVSKDF